MRLEQLYPQGEAQQQVRCWLAFVDQLHRAPGERDFAQELAVYRRCYSRWSPALGPPPAWLPDQARVEQANLSWLMARQGLTDYPALHHWSVTQRDELWRAVIERLGVLFEEAPAAMLDLSAGPRSARWLPGARLSIVKSCFQAPPEQDALRFGGEGDFPLTRLSYRELALQVARAAGGLAALGFGEGDGLALYMPMIPECVVAYLAIVSLGGYVVSVADSFPAAELRRRLRLGGARGVITTSSFLRGSRRIDLYAEVRAASDLPAVVVEAPDTDPPELRAADLSWRALLERGRPRGPLAGEPERMTNVLFSSGTTGAPKAIPWSQLTPLKCAMDGHFHQDLHPTDVVAWPSNVGWMMGPWLIYASLLNRATMALYAGRPGGPGFVQFVREAGVTVLGVVPSLVRGWRQAAVPEPGDWAAVRLFSSTGEPANEEDYLWLMSRAGYHAPVIEYCGGTEIGGGYVTGTVIQPCAPATFTTPALGLELQLLDTQGRQVAAGQTGEVYLVPPSIGLSSRLLNADHEAIYHEGTPRGAGGEPLRRHGDQMVQLPGGVFRAQGRADDTMNLGGIKISAVELEHAVAEHPAIFECAAVAVHQGGSPEQLVFFVVPRAGAAADEEQLTGELGRLVARNLNPLFRVHQVVIADSLPRTATNKVMRRILRQRYEAIAGESRTPNG